MASPPDIVIEIVSDDEGGKLDRKFDIYARMRATYYVVYDPQLVLSNKTLRVFELQGMHYVERADAWLPDVGLGLVLWQGVLEGRQDTWLRWCDQEGNILLTGIERAEQERQRAEQAEAAREQERQRAERLAAQLRALGVDANNNL